MIVPGKLVCSSFLISVCMFIVLKTLLISSITVIVRTGRSHLVEPLCYDVVYCVYCCNCRVLCFVHVLCVCAWYVSGYVRKKDLLQCLCNY